ncbi:MAG: DUF5058 family protein [bacterium]|nr:DUF5058 family protein [bacterium]
MKEYLDIANSGYFYIWGVVILLVIFVQSVLFIRLSWREGKRIGLSSAKMLKGLRAGMISAIIPSIPIVISLIAMAAVLGVPFPWIRLSVIGSGPYELLAAGIGAKSMGVEGLSGAGFTTNVFANCVWVMTIGSMWSGLIVFFFLKVIRKKYEKIGQRDPKWMAVISSAAFFGVICIFLTGQAMIDWVHFLTTIVGALLMTVFALLITKANINWLKEYALPFSMVGAMAGAVFISQLLAK